MTATPTTDSATPDSGSLGTPEPVPGLFWGIPGGPSGPTVAGTRCWGRQCIDMIGPLTPAEPATVPAATELQLQFEGGEPDSAQHAWIRAVGLEPEATEEGLAWPNAQPGDGLTRGPVTTPAEPGEYILVVFAQWDGRGDVSFGGYFNVE
ncbi:MAG: hypothetical protein U5Q44_00235 [Dehalococcoidia bacterium]|nr:hypothetical protein [Dehalococcoidia bacterium]